MAILLALLFALFMNEPFWIYLWVENERFGIGIFPSVLLGAFLLLAAIVFHVILHVFPFRDRHRQTLRLNVMMGGRALVRAGVVALLVGIASLVFLWHFGVPWRVYLGCVLWVAIYTGLIFLNGTVRMFFTSRRLSILYRVLILLFWWVPVINLLVLKKCCRLCKEEYDFAVYKTELRETRAESDMCQTRYPLVMVHGVLFRDLRYFNYWGRIPKELKRYGATVYYGNQEAVGTVARNAADLRAKIQEVMAETGCEKVNIIAHSKGGLDSRYAVTCLGAAPYVASVTTMNTPHRGVKFVDSACNLPEGLYRFIAKIFDGTFRRMGDKEPDFYTATRQFATSASQAFNKEVPDVPGVCYQSYTSRMRSALSDSLLCIPYLLGKKEGQNDGLVAVESAKWGEFRGLLEAPGRRGISHGDIIDLKREDIKGFDVCECYVNIVADLKAKGY